MDVATLVAACRRESGLTQRELAARAGTSAAAVCWYERGERVPRVDTLVRLVAATGASLRLVADPPAAIDLDANARALVDLLDLADHLPQHAAPDLEAPVFAASARGGHRDAA